MTLKPDLWLDGVLAALLVLILCAGGGVPAAEAAPTYVSTITVNSGSDPDDNLSRTCLTHSPCTLRRAIVQARNLPPAQRPVLINFNIPATVGGGYDATRQLWRIQVYSTTQTSIFRRLNGDITIDGSTQPGGRTTGPKIVIVGPGGGMKDGLIVGDVAGQNNHIIRGISFQNLRTHIYLNTDYNTIENNWFGLNDAGTAALLRGDSLQSGSGDSGIAFAAGSTGGGADNNLVRNNRFLGLSGVAMAIRGTHNTISNNYIGTRADGRVTAKQTDPALICSPVDWYGGSGISVADTDNIIQNNVFAGIRLQVLPPTIQADTVRLSGHRHIVRDNRLGLDVQNNEIGVCGRGVYLISGTKYNRVNSNQIYQPGLSAISLNDSPSISTSEGNTMRSNVVKKNTPWGQLDGQSEAENAIQLGPGIHTAFRNFNPAQVTEIDDVTVRGTAGANSPCPNCIIELFLDDTDTIVEALASLAVVTADAQGNWTATLAAPLTPEQGIRTTSTTAQWGTIPNMWAGTTTGLSQLYGGSNFPWNLFFPAIFQK